MQDYLVSIIIPTYNRASILAETLDAVKTQTYANWECLIIDDGSSDDSVTIAKSYAQFDNRFQVHCRPFDRPKGANACRNYGFEIAVGSFINWFDSDDVMSPYHLESHLQAHASTVADATISLAVVFDETPSKAIRNWSVVQPQEDVVREMIESKVAWQTGAIVWRGTSVPKRPFREDLASSQEWTFHLMQILNGLKYTFINNTTCYIRDHDQRIGKSVSEDKVYSTFHSRRYILNALSVKNQLTPQIELALLKRIFLALRQCLMFKYWKLFAIISKYLAAHFKESSHKLLITKVLCVAVPVYFLSGRGERLFSTKI